MPKLFKNPFFYTGLLSLMVLGLTIGSYAFGWTPPSATPPGGNVGFSFFPWIASDSDIFYNTDNVGIGTMEPGEKLEVAGAIKIGTAIGTENGTIRWTGSDFEGRKSGSWVSLTATSTDTECTPSKWTTLEGNIFYNTGNVGIGTTEPKNKLDVEGGAVIGTTYSGTNTAPPNGLLVEGNVGIGKIAPSEKLEVLGAIKIGTAIGTENGTIRWTGSDFEGRISGSWVSLTARGSGFATSTDLGESNVYYNTNYYIDGVSKTGTLQRACYSTGAKELGTTGNFCGDSQGTAVAGDICNSTKAWVDGSLITGDRTACEDPGGCATSTDPGISTVYYDTNYLINGVSKTGTLQRACYSTGAKELGTTGNFCGDDQGTAVAGDICNSTKAWVDGSLITGDRTACSESGGSSQVLPATGQTISYATTTQLCADGGTGICDDAYYKKVAALSYTDNEDGTITDNNTGLMWKRCSEPGTATSTCSSASGYTWQNAINRCEGLDYAGYTDWRMPNVKELWSIAKLEPGSGAPYINTTFFPTPSSYSYWTSTSSTITANNILIVTFNLGGMSQTAMTSSFRIRCVRAG